MKLSKGFKYGLITGIIIIVGIVSLMFINPMGFDNPILSTLLYGISFPYALIMEMVIPTMKFLFCDTAKAFDCLGLIEPTIFVTAFLSVFVYGLLGILVEKMMKTKKIGVVALMSIVFGIVLYSVNGLIASISYLQDWILQYFFNMIFTTISILVTIYMSILIIGAAKAKAKLDYITSLIVSFVFISILFLIKNFATSSKIFQSELSTLIWLMLAMFVGASIVIKGKSR
jgi:hypothetical protein